MTDLALPARVRRLRRPGSAGTTVAVVVLAGVVAAALLAPVLWPLDQSAVDLSRTRLA
ncbi:ABC transporter permease, partial [Micromonospora chalcea]